MARFSLFIAATFCSAAACAPIIPTTVPKIPVASMKPDPRIGLRAGIFDAAEASWNLRLLSKTPPSEKFLNSTNSDLAFIGNHAFQGSYNGYQVWDISNPARPTLEIANFCPASQSDVSVYKNLLFVSGESLTGRLDCGGQGVKDTVSAARLRGIRIFDITDIRNPKNVGNVQTCRGSHTHTVLVDPKDRENIYIYVSGSAPVRSPTELRGCVGAIPEQDSSSSLFRIEVIKVPLAHPERASIVSSPRIFNDLAAPVIHPDAPEDIEAAANALAKARSTGGFIGIVRGTEEALSEDFIKPLLDSVVAARGGTGAATAVDTAALRAALPALIARRYSMPFRSISGELLGPSQCHDITVYPAIGLAGGACAGYGLLLDIRDPVNPVRIGAVSDPNFSYWHSATFNNDGSKVLFSDEWGGGSHPKCRSTDKPEWGANAIFSITGRTMDFKSYYKLPAPQTSEENCVAHNGSLVPIPGRDVMIQAWYQGGISLFEWTDPSHPVEIGFFDRGPVDSTRNVVGGSWSAYWYNGVIVSSEIVRGLDILELAPSEFISQNEIDAAKSVHFEYLNAQGQPKLEWPPSFALAGAYVDQLQRSNSLSPVDIADVRDALSRAQSATGSRRQELLSRLAKDLGGLASRTRDPAKVTMLTNAIRDLLASGH